MNHTHAWFKTVVPIASIFAFRMLGLFMLIPIFTIYANHLTGATPVLIGLAVGVYGLSQGLLQIPFGLLSDRVGRKPMIAIGLTLFIAGSLLGAVSTSIYLMILARFLQGMGAVGSVLIALTADLTRNSDRTKGMAVIGLTIGVSFSLAMIISPLISQYFGLSGIFYLTAMLAFIGLLMLNFVVPTPSRQSFHLDCEPNLTMLSTVLSNRQLLAFDFGIFCQHLIMTATFFALPLILKHELAYSFGEKSLYFYLPVMLGAFLLMVPFIIYAEKKQKMPHVFLGAVMLVAMTQFLLSMEYRHVGLLTGCLLIYFIGFNVMEALLPSLISRKAPIRNKGTAMGVYSTCQFLGIFIGGILAGIVFHWYAFAGIFLMNTVVALLWFAASAKVDLSNKLSSYLVSFDNGVNISTRENEIQMFPGVETAEISKEESVIYLKVNKNEFNLDSFKLLIND